MRSGHRAEVRILIVAALAFAVTLTGWGSSPARADVPPAAVGAFEAPTCAGETDYNPTENPGSLGDLLRVFDGDPGDPRVSRLEAYNLGLVVPLYDSYGLSDLRDPDFPAFPPVCTTHYDAATGGPVSEWTYCTDYTAHSCADVDEDGFGLWVTDGGTPTDLATATLPVDPPGNPRLTAGQEKLIAYLIQHGHSFEGTGYYDYLPGGGWASSETTNQRVALQTLIWCVSDYGYDPANTDFIQTCDQSLSPVMQQALIDSIPDAPVLTLALSSPSESVAPGVTVRLTLETNVFDQPLTVATALPVTVCAGPATLVGDQLQVYGTDATVPATVVLCATAPASGQATVQVSVTPTATDHIGWNQASSGVQEEPCQVYATFHSEQAATLSGTAVLAIGETALAATGAEISGWAILAALGLIGVGIAFLGRRLAMR